MTENPYSHLPDNRFWKRAVAARSPFELSDLYTKKFDIGSTDMIATAGSCFAQHIAKRLQKSGYLYLDTEPAPFNFPPDDLERYGYGLYSARFGNLYTSRQLLQLIQRSLGRFEPVEQIVESRGLYYDLLRPTLQPDGFLSRQEVSSLLEEHLKKVREMFRKTDVFVFTFGLTEAWVDRRDGTAYPVCPGTAAGEFNPDKYEFKNFTFGEVMEDMKQFIELFREINPKVRFLFTVSPVPLVATASSQHVLPATIYSKSILRAVAGELEQSDPFIDYFPSYEVISGIQARSMFYNADLRTVHLRGVDTVMEHFFKQHPSLKDPRPPVSGRQYEEKDPVCDEIILDVEKTKNA